MCSDGPSHNCTAAIHTLVPFAKPSQRRWSLAQRLQTDCGARLPLRMYVEPTTQPVRIQAPLGRFRSDIIIAVGPEFSTLSQHVGQRMCHITGLLCDS